jgi:hypothetical protein
MPSVQCQLFKLIMPLLRRVRARFPTQDLKACVRYAGAQTPWSTWSSARREASPCATTTLPAWERLAHRRRSALLALGGGDRRQGRDGQSWPANGGERGPAAGAGGKAVSRVVKGGISCTQRVLLHARRVC